MEPSEAYSLYAIGKLNSNQIVSLANEWLQKGIYTESLGELYDISDPIMSDVAPIFEKAMQELGLKVPSKSDAIDTIIYETLKRIALNKTNPEEGASFLYWNIQIEFENEMPDAEFVGDKFGLQHMFGWLREIWDCRDGSIIFSYNDLPRPEAEKKFMEHLREEAEKLFHTRYNQSNY